MRELGLAGEGVEVVHEGREYLEVARGGGEGLMEGVHTVQTSGVAEIVRMWRSESIGNNTLLLTVEWKRWYMMDEVGPYVGTHDERSHPTT